jgi:DNA recombination protein RmuC
MNELPALDFLHLTFLFCFVLSLAGVIWAALAWMRADERTRRAREELAVARVRLEHAEGLSEALEDARGRIELLASEKAAAEAEGEARAAAFAEKEANLLALRAEVQETFQGLAADALRRDQASFLEVANETLAKQRDGAQAGLKELLTPVQEAFSQFRQKVEQIQTVQAEDRAGLTEQLKTVADQMRETRDVTGRLVTALRASPKTRGRWGEEQLRNILELSGLSAFADFTEQSSHQTETGVLRPDVVIRMPGERSIVIDSKVALDAYLEAVDAPDETAREALLVKHAGQLRTHMSQLASKAYQANVPASADFVAMFVPGENFFVAAAERDPDLFNEALARKVVIVTPATLFALAKAVAFGWRQAEAERNAREIAQLGKELYKRLADMGEGLDGLGKKLDGAVKAYNGLIGTVESRVLPQARRFRELEAGDPDREVQELKPLEIAARAPKASEEMGLARLAPKADAEAPT